MKFQVVSLETFNVIDTIEGVDLANATLVGKAKHGPNVVVINPPQQPATNESRPATKERALKVKNVCWCGCGGLTGGKFVPGHDARFHGTAKRYARAVAAGENPPVPAFVHAEAEADFFKWADAELPKAERAVEEAARRAAEKSRETVAV